MDNEEQIIIDPEDKQIEQTPTENQPEQVEPESPLNPPLPKKPRRFTRKKIILLTLVIVVIGGAIAGYLLFIKKDAPTNNATLNESAKPVEEKTPEATPAEVDALLQKFIKPTTGETWLATPKKVSPLTIFKPGDQEEREYYQVGSRGDKTIYITVEHVLGDIIYIFEKGADGKITFVSRPDGLATYNEDSEKNYPDTFRDTVVIDKAIHYDSLTLPQKFEIDKDNVATQPRFYPYIGDFVVTDETKNPDSVKKITLIKNLGGSKLERYEETFADTKLTSIGYTLTSPINTVLPLNYQPLETSLNNYQFSKGYGTVTDNISAISRGCGNRFTSVTQADTVSDSDLVAVGKSSDGKPVYELIDTNATLLTKAYDEFAEYNKGYAESQFPNLTKEEFIRNHGLLFFKDSYGQWLAYTRDQLRAVAGCAKPVLSLYPTRPQTVSVRVGATVKVSEPFYNPLSGWNVLAQPNGKITVSGQPYDSLFWEGPGYGEYPVISKGIVVERSKAEATISNQLTQQGLNQKEINDFLAYWIPNLPDKPYVRLSWLSTTQVNKLAPLSISPKPDTLIRVFLDFSGLDEPIDIQPQYLTSIPRNGFTVVEWGGLATKKLY